MCFFVKDMLELICNYLLNDWYPVKDSSRNNYEVQQKCKVSNRKRYDHIALKFNFNSIYEFQELQKNKDIISDGILAG
ncbi:hypothetical protein RO3G_11129 [Rhizopus delemar RA 99-880]|uniref:Uncharacterized protein n=1 Tax=Rhizopus delemar (strain RA 99-880 / ATCC MYA-4621 / FGSC 9543 / NRRL 43880) TaxID=246409 RepID=I1CD88_RHIO9|nr:hypothetical protein RO3G_11129 [Rhizopus delemar RA 99-880]|eukprot:EIE86418.1 hypothetical protein RO3G_11129 [Rhizopus delemar RA 99-880]